MDRPVQASLRRRTPSGDSGRSVRARRCKAARTGAVWRLAFKQRVVTRPGRRVDRPVRTGTKDTPSNDSGRSVRVRRCKAARAEAVRRLAYKRRVIVCPGRQRNARSVQDRPKTIGRLAFKRRVVIRPGRTKSSQPSSPGTPPRVSSVQLRPADWFGPGRAAWRPACKQRVVVRPGRHVVIRFKPQRGMPPHGGKEDRFEPAAARRLEPGYATAREHSTSDPPGLATVPALPVGQLTFKWRVVVGPSRR